MQTEAASQIILANLMSMPAAASASVRQMRMWLVPQKAENDYDYDINPGYFEGLLRSALDDLVARGYITSSSSEDDDTVEEAGEAGGSQNFSLTQKGIAYLEQELGPMMQQQQAEDDRYYYHRHSHQ